MFCCRWIKVNQSLMAASIHDWAVGACRSSVLLASNTLLLSISACRRPTIGNCAQELQSSRFDPNIKHHQHIPKSPEPDPSQMAPKMNAASITDTARAVMENWKLSANAPPRSRVLRCNGSMHHVASEAHGEAWTCPTRTRHRLLQWKTWTAQASASRLLEASGGVG